MAVSMERTNKKEYYGIWNTGDGRRKAGSGRRETEDGGQNTEGGGRKDDGRPILSAFSGFENPHLLNLE